MSLKHWHHTYTGHAAWQAVEDTIELVSKFEGNDDTQNQQIDRIRITLSAVLDLRLTPSVMVSEQMLQLLQQNVTANIFEPINTWSSSNNATYLTNAHTNLHTVLEVVRGWPVSKQQNLRSAAAVLREIVKSSSEHVESMRLASQDTIDELQKQLAFVQEQMNKRDKESIAKFNEISTQATAVMNKLRETDKRNDNLVNALQGRFDEAEELRSQSHETLLDAQKTDFETLVKTSDDFHQKALDRHETEAKATQSRINDLKRDIEGVVGAVGTTSTAKWYMDHADSQGKEANFWRWFAVGGFMVASLYSFVWLTWYQDSNTELRSTVFRGLLSLTLIGFATYATTESRNHRKQEVAARATELKLRSFDPFIATLTEKERRELKMESTRYMFMSNDKVRARQQPDYLVAEIDETE